MFLSFILLYVFSTHFYSALSPLFFFVSTGFILKYIYNFVLWIKCNRESSWEMSCLSRSTWDVHHQKRERWPLVLSLVFSVEQNRTISALTHKTRWMYFTFCYSYHHHHHHHVLHHLHLNHLFLMVSHLFNLIFSSLLFFKIILQI